MLINQKDLDFWIESELNVLFKGKHGSGKTARVIEVFERHKLHWKYFSASTMDPWVDFVGIPKEKMDANGHHYLDFIRPREMEEDDVQAIFFDEFNRCPKKVLNAVMELIQFKSINGRKFKNLKFIWAAVNENAEDEQTYSVETIDPAQLDRFQVHVDVPYKLDSTYFITKYGRELYNSTAEWWETIPVKSRDAVSPRRVDYALEVWQKGGNISYVLPKASNPHDLLTRLSGGPFKLKFNNLVKEKFPAESVEEAFKDVNFVDWVVKHMSEDKVYTHTAEFIKHIPDDMVSKSISDNSKKAKYLEALYETEKGLKIILDIKTANVASPKVILRLEKLLSKKNPELLKSPFLDIENKFDISKITTSAKRLEAFDYLYNQLSDPMGVKFTPQEMMYSVALMNYIVDHTSEASFKSKYLKDSRWTKVLDCFKAGIDASIVATPTISSELSTALQEIKDWTDKIVDKQTAVKTAAAQKQAAKATAGSGATPSAPTTTKASSKKKAKKK